MKAFATVHARRAMWIAWPAFLAALVAEIAFFAIFDPLDFNARLALSREAAYTLGFIALWLLGMLSSALSLYLQRASPDDGEEPLA